MTSKTDVPQKLDAKTLKRLSKLYERKLKREHKLAIKVMKAWGKMMAQSNGIKL